MAQQQNTPALRTHFLVHPTRSYSNSVGITINNSFEAKVRDRDTTATEPKKITLLDNLNISTSYNLAGEQFQLSPVRMSTALKLFNDELSVNLNATFDPLWLRRRIQSN